MHRLQGWRNDPQCVHPINGPYPVIPKAVFNFSGGLVQVQVNGKIQLFGV